MSKNLIDEKYIRCENTMKILENKTVPFSKLGIEVAEMDTVCDKKVKEIVIPEVNIIGSWAFSECKNLTEITIPESVEYIAGGAFYECVNLKKVVFKNPDTNIYAKAFLNCSDMVFYAEPDGEVEFYAQKHKIKFEKISKA